MIIGIPKEIKNNENRVGVTPAGVKELTTRGHVVYVQKTAGEGSGFSDEEYIVAGATMLETIEKVYSSRHNIENELPTTDLVIGSVLIPGAKAPWLITRDMLKLMTPGTVIVDVAIDQGGCFETSVPTTHSNPTYSVDGILHYAVANIPGAVPRTSTLALTNATLPYAIKLADMGWKEMCKKDLGLADGVNIVDGKITFKAVAETFDMPYTPFNL